MIALMLRLDTIDIPARFHAGIVGYTVGALFVRLVMNYWFGLYRQYWRFASIGELLQIIFSVGASTILITVLLIAVRAFIPFTFARSVILLDALLILLLIGGARFSARAIGRLHQKPMSNGAKSVLIAGAGEAGAMILRELQRNPQLNQVPVGFMDDDPAKQGMSIHGVAVLGTREDFKDIVPAHGVDRVIIAMPTAPGSVIREIVDLSEGLGVEAKTIPGIYELLDGTVTINQVRDVDIEDLLRREPVQTDFAAVKEMLAGKRVLVTGGGGSIGSELCRQVYRCLPERLIILGHGENAIFEIVEDIKLRTQKTAEIVPVVADIRFPSRINSTLRRHRPEIIFHAAAHKHVPLMEVNAAEAVTNNILGTEILLKAALDHDVDRFVLISTDKAVSPTSIMGASKRVAELLVLRAAEQSGRAFVSVRFGNVLGSRGSAILKFKKQIRAGGPITITHPDMKRYFMTIPEAVQLVLQASVMGAGGEVFMLDMGEPLKILGLAKDLIELSGLESGTDIEIEFTGVRPGEKLSEELFVPGESYHQTEHEKIFIVDSKTQGLPGHFDRSLWGVIRASTTEDREKIVEGLRKIVPEYLPGNGGNGASTSTVESLYMD